MSQFFPPFCSIHVSTGHHSSCWWHSCLKSVCWTFRSPTKTSVSGSSFRWSKQEKELFEEGLVSLSSNVISCFWCLDMQVSNNSYMWQFVSVLSKCLRSVFLQAQFGRRWTKIAKLVGSRTVLQVKSYARQYFKHKVRLYFLPAAA